MKRKRIIWQYTALLYPICHLLWSYPVYANEGDSLRQVVENLGTDDEMNKAAGKFIGVFKSVYGLFYSGSVILIVIALAIAFVRMAYAKGRGYEMAKDWVMRICIAAIFIGAASIIITLLVETGQNMNFNG